MATKFHWFTGIIKIVDNFCNLRCKYCFFHGLDQTTPTRMSERVLREVIKKFLSYGPPDSPVQFLWHGGEPLLAGIDFFEKIVDIQRFYNIENRPIENSIQTNGTLITERWAEWLSRHNFKVGVSIDGTPSIHNAYRVDVNGRGSWERTLRGIKFLQSQGVSVGALMVVHADNYLFGRDAVFSLYQQGVRSIGFNFYFEPERPEHGYNYQEGLFVSPAQAFQFISDALEAWLEIDDPTFKIREIDDLVAVLLGRQASICSFSGTCDHYISITTEGDIYPCERIPQTPSMFFGNVLKIKSLADILTNSNFQHFQRRVKFRTPDCEQCEIAHFCNNGCTHHRVEGKYYFCTTRRQSFQLVKDVIGEQIFYLEKEVAHER